MHPLYRQWRDAPHASMLHVTANPGCGKSVLARHLIDEELKTSPTTTICYFFFKDGLEEQTSTTIALRCVLHQLLTQRREDLFSNRVLKRFEETGYLLKSTAELWDLLVDICKDVIAGEVICVFDAYDECKAAGREVLSKIIRSFYNSDNKQSNLKVLLTSRPYNEIRRSFQPDALAGLPIIHLGGENKTESDTIAQEINLVIDAEVAELSDEMGPDDRRLLRTRLGSVPNRTYLWVYLTLDVIRSSYLGRVDIIDITSPGNLPMSVEEAYEKILSRSKDAAKARLLLNIVLAAVRPLDVAEVAEALAMRQSHMHHSDLELGIRDKLPDYLRTLCGLFITITDSRVYFLHQTAREFLLPAASGVLPTAWAHSFQLSAAHCSLAEICVHYLLMKDYETLAKKDSRDHSLANKFAALRAGDFTQVKHALLRYAAQNWYIHCRESDYGNLEAMLKLCGLGDGRLKLGWINAHFASSEDGDQLLRVDMNPLIIAACCGLPHVSRYLLQKEPKLAKALDRHTKRSAISHAAERGNSETLRQLLETSRGGLRKFFQAKNNSLHNRCTRGRTPLAYAALNGHTAAAKMLIRAGAQVHVADEDGWDVFLYAVCSGDQTFVEEIFRVQGDIAASLLEEKLVTMATEAVIQSRPATLQRILRSGIVGGSSNLPRKWWASVDVALPIFLALGNDENSNTCVLPQMLLQLAVLLGNLPIIETLLTHDRTQCINTGDETLGARPLHWAVVTCTDPVEVTKILLAKGADLGRADAIRGLTPLHWAVMLQKNALALLCLDRGANVNEQAQDGSTVLSMCRSFEFLQTLISRGASLMDGLEALPLCDADNAALIPWIRNFDEPEWLEYSAPILWHVVRSWGPDITWPQGESRWAPAIWGLRIGLVFLAISDGNAPVMHILLKGLHSSDSIIYRPYSRTSRQILGSAYSLFLLYAAAFDNSRDVVQVLLDCGADPNSTYNKGTVIDYAAAQTQLDAAYLLLCRGAAFDIVAQGPALVYRAVYYKHSAVIAMLLDRGIDVNIVFTSTAITGTLLQIATTRKHLDIMAQIVDRGAVVDLARVSDGRTSLHIAAGMGFMEGVDLLLKHSADVNARDADGFTPLDIVAARMVHLEECGLGLDIFALLHGKGAKLHKFKDSIPGVDTVDLRWL